MSKYAKMINRLIEANGPNFQMEADIKEMCGEQFLAVPNYTASLSEALALAQRMLDGEWIDIGGIMGRPSRAQWECNIHTDYCEVRALAPTAPLAVLLATFRALEAKEGT